MGEQLFESTMDKPAKTFQVRGFKFFQKSTATEFVTIQAKSYKRAIEEFLYQNYPNEYSNVEVNGKNYRYEYIQRIHVVKSKKVPK